MSKKVQGGIYKSLTLSPVRIAGTTSKRATSEENSEGSEDKSLKRRRKRNEAI